MKKILTASLVILATSFAQASSLCNVFIESQGPKDFAANRTLAAGLERRGFTVVENKKDANILAVTARSCVTVNTEKNAEGLCLRAVGGVLLTDLSTGEKVLFSAHDDKGKISEGSALMAQKKAIAQIPECK